MEDMTIDKVVKEIQNRIDILEQREDRYRRQMKDLWYGITDDYYFSLPTDNPQKIKLEDLDKKLRKKINQAHDEKAKLRDMLYEYNRK